MTDDDLLASLGRTARVDSNLSGPEERLLQLTEGKLSPDEILELEREVGADAVAAHRPLPSDFRDKVAERLDALLPPEPRATVTPLRPRPRWVMPAAVAVMVAAAAAVFLFFGTPRTPSALPGYELALSGGEREIRGTNDEPIRLTPGSRLTLLVRPSTGTTESVTAFVFLKTSEGLVSIPVKSESSAAGAIKLELAESDLPPGAGPELEWVVVVGHASALRSPDDAKQLATRGSGPEHQVLEARSLRGK